ncbi:MAG: fused MFS/spermidine synthase [Planctomycetes bacterium]|nr:fused MFS/spermidine synthase [Planctomycetota bacterium]MCA8935348.1 fused MFS/spermidine synthase [Planctomycetota bacterium]
MLKYAVTIFVSAFLLFQVQPLISRYILPWFGGTPGVWSVAMLFFQGVLLGGYAYAHLSISRFKPKVQLGVHLALLVGCLATLPIIPPESLKPDGGESPELLILLLLLVSVGLPYFALSATGPLLQAWFSRSYPKKSPYALYALSNVGSLLALLSYPFVIEPLWGRESQALNWTYVFVAFVVLCGLTAVAAFIQFRKKPDVGDAALVATAPDEKPEDESNAEEAGTAKHQQFMWIAFAGCATVLLLAFTNQLCVDVASIPFLWVLPLSLYLFSFIVTFASERWYKRPVMLTLLAMALGGTTAMLWFDIETPLQLKVVGYSLALFIFCMVCHGEAYRLRPAPIHLTKFYLSISLGGVLGGAFVALLAPVVFTTYLELPAGMLATGLLVLIALSRDPKSLMHGGKLRWAWVLVLLCALGLTGTLSFGVIKSQKDTIESSRNFYGTFRVKEPPEGSDQPWIRTLMSGSTVHGMQYMDGGRQALPTSYYGLNSGIGLTLTSFPHDRPLRIGVIGLGTGTLAAYGKRGDYMRFYEINEHVHELATEYFLYLENTQADVDVVIGDARLILEKEEPQKFDVLVLDAFSSDSIPVHLLTIEAFEQYDRHLAPGGVLCVHISNRHLDLFPVVAKAAQAMGTTYLGWFSGADRYSAGALAMWVILTRNPAFQKRFEKSTLDLMNAVKSANQLDRYQSGFGNPFGQDRDVSDFKLWTDDYSNLYEILR